jgi:hypothetical protein
LARVFWIEAKTTVAATNESANESANEADCHVGWQPRELQLEKRTGVAR